MPNIYYLGPDGSNAHNAMLRVSEKCTMNFDGKIPQKTIRMTLESLVKDENSLCVLPIENSIEGIVRETIDNLLKIKDENIKIQGEISLPIKHLLLSKSKDKSTIKKILSHPQALAQCGKYLYKNFKEAELKEVSSTSYAAQKVALENDVTLAAIANETCASLFDLNVLSQNLNDEIDNKTRFYILGRKPLENRNNNGKTAIILSTKNKPGALCDVLQIYAKHGLNLTYIDSRPSKRKLGEYLFFMEIDGFETDSKIMKALEELNGYVDFIKVLGSFCIYS